ncbi:hypothetical protein AK812_SmicGene961 [Symbiodinium microadriaticum]|uniref:Uncharacterized protein n=1 Tax=Symbiodinium microadriaticum TaxID=2951 RepID=A0A1Q9F570_SYMMI|nr:hypothetical protein AK812_SmicGene961 [Symbiodinium microadriaticum]
MVARQPEISAGIENGLTFAQVIQMSASQLEKWLQLSCTGSRRDPFGAGGVFASRQFGRPKLEQQLSTDIVRQALRLLWHCGNCPQGRCETLEAECLPTALLDADDKAVARIYGNLDATRAKLVQQKGELITYGCWRDMEADEVDLGQGLKA